MRNYLALIVFGLMLAEALSSRPPIDFGGPDFEDEPGLELDKLTSDDINGEEPLLETRGHTLGHNEGEPDFEEEPEEEVESRPPPYNEELGVEPEEEAEAGDFEPESVEERTLPGEEERDLEQKYLMLMPEDLEGPGGINVRAKRATSGDGSEDIGNDILEVPNDVWQDEENQFGSNGGDKGKDTRQATSSDDIVNDILEVPNDVWQDEENQFGSNGGDKGKDARQATTPPSSACLNIKLIFNQGWVRDAGRGDLALAEQKARDVLNEAQNIYQTKYAAANRLGTSITFNLVGGAPVYDSTGSYQATGNALGSNDVLNHIDTSSYSTQHYAFLTGYDGSGSPIGIAYVGTPCLRLSQDQRYKTSINEWYRNTDGSAAVLAHEIGHALGMLHDFGSSTSDIRYDSAGNQCTGTNGIMDYGVLFSHNKFSTCSKEDFASWYNHIMNTYGSFCLTCANNPTQAPTAPTTTAPAPTTTPPAPTTRAPTTPAPARCSGVPYTDWNCCSRRNPCDVGGGDCDRDSDCAQGLKCGTDNCLGDFSSPGSNWGMVADCCFADVRKCDGDPRVDWSCCTPQNPCDVGGGDCDYDYDCKGDLKCGNNNCKADFSSSGSNWPRSADCCEAPPPTTPAPPRCSGIPNTDWNCCNRREPCDIGGGDCDRDSDCLGDLVCGTDNCKTDFSLTGSNWYRTADCCEAPPPTTPPPTTPPPPPPCSGIPYTDWACCSSANPCDIGGGDCDRDTDCAGDLTCGNNNCVADFSTTGSNWSQHADCCDVPAPTTPAPARCSGVPYTNWNCCNRRQPCDVGGGDCDRDSDCLGDLTCGSNNCKIDFSSPGSNWAGSADCCEGTALPPSTAAPTTAPPAPTTAAPTTAPPPPTTAAPTTAAPTTAPPPPTTAAPTTAAPTTAPPPPTTAAPTTATPAPACGMKPQGIVGGGAVTPYSLPWQVALVRSGGNRPFCGGTLISPNHVLTAAHCMVVNSFDVIVGEHSISDTSDGTRHEVCRSVSHPSYSSSSVNNDFAIVHLRTPVTLGPRAVPACLADSSVAGDALAGQSATVSGWGTLSSGGQSPNVLHKVSVPVITNAQCRTQYSGVNSITNEMICAGNIANGGVDSCQGDSGGPLTYDNNGRATLLGVVSWGVGCAQPGYPGVYARVTEGLSFINDQLTQGCSMNSYQDP